MDFLTTFDEKTKIWSGPAEVPFYDTNCSIGQVIFEQMKNNPTKVCQVSDVDDRRVTNATALQWSISIAKHLKQLNLRAPECVGIIGKNTNYLMAVTYGCLWNTTPFHAINPAHEEELIKHAFGITKPRLIFCDANVYENVFNATKSWQPTCYTLDKTLENVQSVESLLKESAADEYLNYYPELLTEGATQTVAILCSSGTTGLPKAVCIQNKDLFYSCRVFADDVLYSLSGIDWISGLSTLILAGIRGCLRIITNKPFTPQYFANLVHKHKITYFATPPRIIALLLANALEIGEQLRSLRLVLCGGGCFTEAMFSGMQRLISPHGQLSQLYALTEFGLVSSNYKKTKQTSPGFLRAGLQARIIDDDGVSLGPNASGELLLNIGRKWNGYFNNPKATAEVIDEGNWLHTGDIAYFDNDGYLFIVDRKKETMKNNGFHYWPTEIENIITELPDVIEACVIGVYDELSGHIPAALVRKLSSSNLSADDIKAYVAQRCPGYKHLNAGVIFVDALPLNKNGKVLRREAKVLFEELTRGIETN